MAEKMTLGQVLGDMNKLTASGQDAENWQVVDWCAAIRAHLAQPAQAVDVDAVRDVIAECERNMHGIGITGLRRMAGKLTRAIGNVQEDGWKVGATLPIDVRGKWFEVPVPVHLHVIALRDRVDILDSAENLVAVYDAVSRSNLMRDVKTPETKARIVRNALSSAKPQPEE